MKTKFATLLLCLLFLIGVNGLIACNGCKMGTPSQSGSSNMESTIEESNSTNDGTSNENSSTNGNTSSGESTGDTTSPYDEYFTFVLQDDNTYGLQQVDTAKAPETVTIPSTYKDKPVTAILDFAFSNCINVKVVIIPESVVKIGISVFIGCANLNCIEVNENNQYFTSINGNLYNKDASIIIQYAIGKLDTEFAIPDSVTVIGFSAFANCSNLTKVIFNINLITIEDNAFENCTNLIRVFISINVISIGDYAFRGCTSLIVAVIPQSVITIGINVFLNCSTDIYVENKEDIPTDWNNNWNGSTGNLYLDCSSIKTTTDGWVYTKYNLTVIIIAYVGIETEVTIPDKIEDTTVTQIGSGAFYGNTTVIKVNISINVTHIGSYAFAGCVSIIYIVIPENVVYVGINIFLNCSTDIYVENKEDIPTDWNNNWNGSTGNLYLGCSSIKTTTDGWVYTKYNLTVIIIAYVGIETEVTIPDKIEDTTVTQIGSGAFYGNTTVIKVNISINVTHIGSYAFAGCTSIVYIVIPKNVEKIEANVFVNCENISIFIQSNVKPDDWNDEWNGSNGYVEWEENETIDSNLIYKKVDNEIHIIDYTGNATEITIPKMIEGYPVTHIDAYAFENCTTLGKVILPIGLLYIGEYAFHNCTSLKKVVVPETIEKVSYLAPNAFWGSSLEYTEYGGGNYMGSKTNPYAVLAVANNVSNFEFHKDTRVIFPYAFQNCYNITSVVIPDSVLYLGCYAFVNCRGLTSATIPNSVLRIEEATFSGCTSLKEVTLGNSIVSIGDEAFYGCSGLTEIIIPDSVIEIGVYAFGGCGLTNVVIGNGITSIGEASFWGCNNLESIVIPSSVNLIGDMAFEYCYSITAIYYKGTEEDWNKIVIGYLYDSNFTRATRYYYSETEPTTSGNYWHYDENGEIVVWEYVAPTHTDYSYFTFTELSDGTYGIAAKDVNNMPSEVILPSTYNGKAVTIIEANAFSGCSKLTSITIPDSITSIGEDAFYNCSSLTEITLPFVGASKSATGYQSVFGYIFGYTRRSSSSAITNATYQYYVYKDNYYYHYYIPNSLKKVTITGDNINGGFYNCSRLTSITIGNSVTSIGKNAFKYCSSLTSVTIGNGVTSIGENAFEDCTSLTSITIPDSVTSIGERAFYDCSSLTSVTIGNSVASIGDWAFCECSSLTSVVIPDSVTSIGSSAFSSCSRLTSVTIPDSVTLIGSSAFRNCSSLTSVTIGNGVTSIGYWAFYNCSSLTKIVIPNSVTSIGDWAFFGCSSLTKVNYLGTIDQWAQIEFDGSDSNPTYYAKNLYINNKLVTEVNLTTATKISSYAFEWCSSLTSVTIGNSVTSIGQEAFYYCSKLTSITIGNSVTSIGQEAFFNCSSLTSVTIGNSVTSIGKDAFLYCTNLKTVYYNGTKEDWNKIAIDNTNNYNSYLINATRYYSETEPTTSGKYWHYVNGVPTPWIKP